uniref:Protein kinase domain-containing protein n=1 Tax=Heterorhabditis bacteriophora TaxID=37862 RepID=A0A1I7XNV3_HETBA
MTDVPKRKRSLNIRDARIAGLYDLEHTIGQGHFAVVKLARHVFTGEKVRCMKLVQHANIVRLYEVIDTQTKLFLILELGDYDMHDFIIKHEKGVGEPLAQQYFCQIITAIDYCHRLHVVHRDLKPENVVFFEKLGMVKLTDFGFSNLYEPGQQLRTSCGSLVYSAPEILLGDAYDAPAVDVWSLGVIVYMLVCGRLPFQETNDSETLTKILDCRYTVPDHLSIPCTNLIQRMLVRDPSKRASLAEIVTNSWVVAGDRGHAAVLPLIVRHHLPHSAHTTIIEQMVAGSIGTEDSILRYGHNDFYLFRALENDEYNSMTATYYLLAERILSTYREEQAKELMINECAIVPDDEAIEKYFATEPTSTRSSRCSVLTSRQSSTEDPFDWEHIAHTLRGTAVFDELSPIEENSSVDRLLFDRTNETDRICNEPNSMNVSQQRTRFMRATSETERDLLISHLSQTVLPRKTMQIVRRWNSSPSVSMFGVNTRDRVSPQAVQDLLELSRLGGSRRAASPDSMRSSRSPSPPTSSGRTSPAMSSLSSLSRLKVSSSSLGGGMRKLSSSPHLLGICEEGEEIEQGGSGSLLTTSWAGMARTNRLSFFCRLYLPLLVWSIYVMDQYKQQRVPDHILSRLLTGMNSINDLSLEAEGVLDENDGDQGGISGSTGQSDTSVAITNRSQGGENTTEGSSSTQERRPCTAKQILNHWSGMLPHLSIQDESWHGISRKQLSYTDNINQSNNIYYNDWIRKIQRTRSIEDIIMLQSGSHDISMNMDDSLLSFLDSLCPPSITDNDEETDSSCSSRKDMLKRNVKDET